MSWVGKSILMDRTEAFAVDVLEFTKTLPRNARTYTIEGQLLKSATSVGANYREARQARTPKEMLSKLRIAVGEGEEARYWLRIAMRSSLGDHESCMRLEAESHEIIKMLVATINTVRNKHAPTA